MKEVRRVRVGNLALGDGRVYVQSMTNVDTKDVEATVLQIERLATVGCEIVRVAAYDLEAANALKRIKERISIPLVADIHYDAKIAIRAIEAGVDKIRINPGNIPSKALKEVVAAAKEHGVAIRVGANSGSLKREFLEHYREKHVALAESVLEHVRALERLGFEDIVVSAKSSDVTETVEANRYVRNKVDYPLHVGLTEAGYGSQAIVKSAIAIGTLLMEGIGETIRVSLSADPVEEVRVAKWILGSLHLRKVPDLVACPTCARAEIDVMKLAEKVIALLDKFDKPIKVAVMGCVVNGIGEGADADIGVAGTKSGAVLMNKGRIVAQVPQDEIFQVLRREIENWEDWRA
ncbi:4-hydroxy-3-methylbut-2-en-1-yl diphosphate synthase [Methanosarcinales archaeon]|nr:MAG: 4-hydroxy-3-methylbut-2-en-1-yl diphosphate synthase [Methanosarcinales archaeon]